jgi:hypothetical protein
MLPVLPMLPVSILNYQLGIGDIGIGSAFTLATFNCEAV